MKKFKNKVVLIAGGARGIGFATAKKFLQEGAHVVIFSKTRRNVQRAVKELKKIGSSISGEVGDISSEKTVVRITSKVVKEFKRIDVVVNAAGVSRPAQFEKISLKDWNYMLDNNLTNCFLMCKYVLKQMKKQKEGKVINVSSIAGRFRSKMAGAHYSCSKAAVITLTKQLAAEYGDFGININVVCPSQTMTDMLKPFLVGNAKSKLKKSIPLGYIASPEQQADVILFLASEEASYMTGAVVDVNGGQL